MPIPRQESEWSCVRGIDWASFYDFSIGFINCYDGVVLSCLSLSIQLHTTDVYVAKTESIIGTHDRF
jgi:hypothetical protein